MTAQLPLALRLREGFDLDSYAGPPGLAEAVKALVSGEWGQVYLHGAPGTGRTHLLTAAVRLAEGLGQSACLLPGEEMAHLTPDVLEAFEQFDLVAVDNVDALAGLPDWEEALFHLYNRCREAQGRLLFAALAPPAAAGFALPDLASRLGAGPVYRLTVPDDAALAALLQRRARHRADHPRRTGAAGHRNAASPAAAAGWLAYACRCRWRRAGGGEHGWRTGRIRAAR